jgi:plasmid stabilization system protein ParE
LKINWTPNAKETFEQILDWLSGNWTNKEIENFLDQTESTIEQIKNNPYLLECR